MGIRDYVSRIIRSLNEIGQSKPTEKRDIQCPYKIEIGPRGEKIYYKGPA